MLRYVLLMVLMGFAFSDAYKTKHPRRREYFKSPDYGDYDDYVYPISVYAKDSEAGSTRPSIFSYWNNLLKRTRLPSWNITNPFTRLFAPYVIKVDFPPGTDPNGEPGSQPNRNKKKKTEQQEDYIYLNAEPENTQYFYDPVTQQYYEVQETASQDYNPQNNYYATTFNDDDEIVINLGDNDREAEKNQANDSEEDEVRYSGKVKKIGFMGKYNSPAIKSLKTKRFNIERTAATLNLKQSKRTRKVNRLANV